MVPTKKFEVGDQVSDDLGRQGMITGFDEKAPVPEERVSVAWDGDDVDVLQEFVDVWKLRRKGSRNLPRR